MAVPAVLDARRITQEGLNRRIAGLSLVERALRMLRVNGASELIVWAAADLRDAICEQIKGSREAKRATLVTDFDALRAAVGVDPRVLVVDVNTVYHRGTIKDLMATTDGARRVRVADGLLRAACVPRKALTCYDAMETWLESLEGAPREVAAWQVHVTDDASAARAERALWLDCRKEADGMVSRHINRYGSLFVSRFLAPTAITPNHISVFTFSLGILAGALAAFGGPLNFLWAGVVFQINSVIDGCDGELARVRYEFSVLGEWLDTLSDDFSDVFFWAGLGVGAATTYAGPWGLSSEAWLWLGIVAVAGKMLSMFVYYRWLIANKRGDLLAFTWSVDAAGADASVAARAAKLLKLFAKKDFIVFACMLLGFLGWLPWILVPMAVGNLGVAAGVLLQQRAQS